MKQPWIWIIMLSIAIIGSAAYGTLRASPHTASGALPPSPAAKVFVSRIATPVKTNHNLHFVLIAHSRATDPFWSVIKSGADQAALDMGVTLDYRAPDRFDMQAMAALIDEAVASEPDGLIISIPDAEALSSAIRGALKSDIPVITINSGSEVAADLGILTHVGQPEYDAGFGGGERMALAGVSNALCFIHEPGNVALDFRCKGFEDAVAQAGGDVETISVDVIDNPDEAREQIGDAIASRPDIDGILATGPLDALSVLDALRKQQRDDGSIAVAGFDLDPDVLEAIRAGDMLFTIDQQPYLQGYMPVVLLTLHVTNLNTVPSKVIMTGPGIVSADNVDEVIELSRRGTR